MVAQERDYYRVPHRRRVRRTDQGGPTERARDAEHHPTHHHIRCTVVEITIADYPAGSVASIEGDPVPINTTTIVSITRAIVQEIDSSGTVGDVKDKIRPKPLCRWLP